MRWILPDAIINENISYYRARLEKEQCPKKQEEYRKVLELLSKGILFEDMPQAKKNI